MTYLLDTNALSVFVNGRSERLREKIRAVPPRELALCSVVWAELFYGVAKSQNPAETLARVTTFAGRLASLPFDDAAAERYGGVRAELERAGTLIGPNDLMIAAIALCRDLTLVTHNTGEFARVPGLRREDWQ